MALNKNKEEINGHIYIIPAFEVSTELSTP